jgi:phage tail sheath protein FI
LLAERAAGYSLFADADTTDIGLVIMGNADKTLIQYVIDNVALQRRDVVVTYSPQEHDTYPFVNQSGSTKKVIDFKNQVARSTSYAVMDSGHKMMYDRYNDQYLPVPLCGDTAGLMAYTELIRDAWWSPAGFNRGQLRNVVKLYFNPRKTYRDDLYRNNINPCVSLPGEGPVLYGDKTTQTKPSAFDRINVRRLFIVLEKAIARASKYTLFEFNDEFTRAQFRNMVEPFLEDVQGRRGIYDFKVVCDTTNNTPEVIDRNEFIGDIYIKPARSINYITLNFIATRTGVDFSEVGA